jgi:DNA-directed RNA polymerase specialized sigma subunit
MTLDATDPSRTVPGELSDDDLPALCRKYPGGSAERAAACEVLVKRYAPLVRACVRPYLGSPEPAEDLMQVGISAC